jgi:hypothetical protein
VSSVRASSRKVGGDWQQAQLVSMSLKSTTEKIDGIITAATLLFLICVWGAFGSLI